MGGDRGSVTVIAAVLIGACFALAGVVATVCGAQVARSRAQGAADLAALAAVVTTVTDERSACEVAVEVARRSAAEVTGCTVEGDGSVQVVVDVALEPWGTATGSARAGLVYD